MVRCSTFGGADPAPSGQFALFSQEVFQAENRLHKTYFDGAYRFHTVWERRYCEKEYARYKRVDLQYMARHLKSLPIARRKKYCLKILSLFREVICNDLDKGKIEKAHSIYNLFQQTVPFIATSQRNRISTNDLITVIYRIAEESRIMSDAPIR